MLKETKMTLENKIKNLEISINDNNSAIKHYQECIKICQTTLNLRLSELNQLKKELEERRPKTGEIWEYTSTAIKPDGNKYIRKFFVDNDLNLLWEDGSRSLRNSTSYDYTIINSKFIAKLNDAVFIKR